MEPHFAHDFSRVRIHADARAAESAAAVNALAYTVGQNVVFGKAQYAPGTHAGQRILAHELTHVVQQSNASSSESLARIADDSQAESEADEVMARVVSNSPLPSAPIAARRPFVRLARQVMQRWRISGNTATSNSDSDTLGGLAIKAGARFNDWKCIRPLSQRTSKLPTPPANFDARYELYVQKGDTFDISNLTATTGTSVSIYLFADTDVNNANIARRFYPGSVNSAGPDGDFETTANFGRTPISNLLIFGHAAGDTMFGGGTNFTPRDFDPEEDVQTFAQAENAMFPRRCWFTRNATARSVGCNSEAWGNDFARHYLRVGATVTTTTRSVRPTCTPPLINATTGLCNSFDGLDFSSTPAAGPGRLEGPFNTTADFHAGRFWKVIRGKL
jgi:hypothetical protein